MAVEGGGRRQAGWVTSTACVGTSSKDVLIAAGWAEREIPKEQLYDLLFDPNEANNLIDDDACAQVAAELRARLDEWMRDTEDPLLAGHVDPPPGVEINLPDQRSASEPTTRIG